MAARKKAESSTTESATTPKKRVVSTEAKANQLLTKIGDLMCEVVNKDVVEQVVNDALPEIKNKIVEIYGDLPAVTKVTLPSLEVRKVTGITHEKFAEVLTITNANIPVYLEGPAGSGKNVICKQVADALGLDFYFTNAVTQEYKLTGFIDAYGKYQETQFYKAFKNGGLFFLDEMDASIPEVLIILNAAIANRYFDFPCGKVEAHPNFRIIAAGNTIGTGADSNYTGRFCLDRASLDRFAMIHIDYSPMIEAAICDENKSLLSFIREFRRAAKQAGIECICSYRTVERISTLEKVLPLREVVEMSLLKGLEDDDIRILTKEMKNMSKNKYFKAGILKETPEKEAKDKETDPFVDFLEDDNVPF